jgi:hypothetical protein
MILGSDQPALDWLRPSSDGHRRIKGDQAPLGDAPTVRGELMAAF